MSSTEPVATRNRVVIAIDGPAASGKSSTAQWVARDLAFRHVDSGSLYRAATFAARRALPDPSKWTPESVIAAAKGIELQPTEVSFAPFLDGEDVTAETRSIEVTRDVSQVAQMLPVRDWVNWRVREVARHHDVVVDGRDMGTAVFPNADLKVFLVADPWERARRRLIQRLGRAPTDDEIAVETEWLVRRDAADATQTAQARDAVVLDTTFLTQEEQVERIVSLAKAALRSLE
ncbi:MAG: (d)CMP kinase [Gemmatimonadaceae bacterium]